MERSGPSFARDALFVVLMATLLLLPAGACTLAWGHSASPSPSPAARMDLVGVRPNGSLTTVVTSTVAAATVKSGKFKDLEVGKDAPYDIDYVGLIALRQEYGLINYLNLFAHLQTRTGRAQELYEKWVGGTMPDLTVKGVYR